MTRIGIGAAGRIAVQTFLPAACPACGDELGDHLAGVCRCCWTETELSLPPAPWSERPGGRHLESITALGTYDGRLRMMIRCLKYRRLPGVGRHLGRMLAPRLGRLPDPPEMVVPVPLHWSRRWRRGFNQASVIASGAARDLGIPVRPSLRRIRRTASQTGRGRRERLLNVRGAFRIRGPRIEGASVLLVDDVVTTRATVRECARVLRAAGARKVHVAAPARTAHLSVTRSES